MAIPKRTQVANIGAGPSGLVLGHLPHAAGLDACSARCLARIWRAERFPWWFTMLMHRFPDDGPITAKFQRAELDYLMHSELGRRAIAENYVGLPLDFRGPS